MLAASPLCDDVAHLAALDWTADLRGDVLWSCALALAANVSNYYVLGRTSPLTYQVLGHVKTIATIGFSVVVFGCVEINQCVGCTRQFFTKSFLGDDAAVMARSSGEEPASPRHRAGVASMAWRTTRCFSTNAP